MWQEIYIWNFSLYDQNQSYELAFHKMTVIYVYETRVKKSVEHSAHHLSTQCFNSFCTLKSYYGCEADLSFYEVRVLIEH